MLASNDTSAALRRRPGVDSAGPSARRMKIHAALQLCDRIPKWIVLSIVLIVPGALLIAPLIVIGLRHAGAQQTVDAYQSERNISSGGGETGRASHAIRSEANASVGSAPFGGYDTHFYGF